MHTFCRSERYIFSLRNLVVVLVYQSEAILSLMIAGNKRKKGKPPKDLQFCCKNIQKVIVPYHDLTSLLCIMKKMKYHG